MPKRLLLMGHLKEFDEKHSTVIVIHVENETGTLRDSQTRPKIADELVHRPVAEELVQHLQTTGIHPELQERFPGIKKIGTGTATWEEAFGAEKCHTQMKCSWHMPSPATLAKSPRQSKKSIRSRYTRMSGSISTTRRSLTLQDLPPIVAGGTNAGVYTSGGAVPHTIDIWKIDVPALDFISPDLYFHHDKSVCKRYTQQRPTAFHPRAKKRRGRRKESMACLRAIRRHGLLTIRN
jgi:hypothetical protein